MNTSTDRIILQYTIKGAPLLKREEIIKDLKENGFTISNEVRDGTNKFFDYVATADVVDVDLSTFHKKFCKITKGLKQKNPS